MVQHPVSQANRAAGGIMGLIAGDALGVPVEFTDRQTLARHPVTGMQGYGCHRQPPGTWSDDSSLMLCQMESLAERGFDPEDTARLFVKWYQQGYWTPYGQAFGIGRTTEQALVRILQGTPVREAGISDESSNGNGALMRILPVSIYTAGRSHNEIIGAACEASRITHAHMRSQMACCLYSLLVDHLLHGLSPLAAYETICREAPEIFTSDQWGSELEHFSRILHGSLMNLTEDQIQSSGYVVHTLEASIWCILHYDNFAATVLAAVNLGSDTDTTAAVAGGLAGIYYGRENIPSKWINRLARWKDIQDLTGQFIKRLPSRN